MPWFLLVPSFVWKIIISVSLVSGVYLYIQKTGENKAFAKVEKANNAADTRGNKASSNGGKRTASSVRDPHTRID